MIRSFTRRNSFTHGNYVDVSVTINKSYWKGVGSRKGIDSANERRQNGERNSVTVLFSVSRNWRALRTSAGIRTIHQCCWCCWRAPNAFHFIFFFSFMSARKKILSERVLRTFYRHTFVPDNKSHWIGGAVTDVDFRFSQKYNRNSIEKLLKKRRNRS